MLDGKITTNSTKNTVRGAITTYAPYDHLKLYNREGPDQHPIDAITGLRNALDTGEANLEEAKKELKNLLDLETNLRHSADQELADSLAAEEARSKKEDDVLTESLKQNTEALTVELDGQLRIINANKADLEQKISTESEIRKEADQKLTDDLASETERAEAEELRLTDLIDQNTGALNAEIERSTQKESELEQTLNASVADLNSTINTKISEEATAREDSFNQLTAALNQTEVDLRNVLTSEVSNREAAISELQTKLDTESSITRNNENELDQKISTEIENRLNADHAIQAALDAEKTARETEDASLASLISAEVSTRETVDNAIIAKIGEGFDATTTVAKAISALKTASEEALTEEATIRQDADNELSSAINDEVNDRATAITNATNSITAAYEAADSEINAKFGKGISKDNTVVNAIATAKTEAINYVDGDFKTAVQTYADAIVATEKSDRETKDATLDSKISTNATAISNEATARKVADNAINAKIGTGFDEDNTVARKIEIAIATAENKDAARAHTAATNLTNAVRDLETKITNDDSTTLRSANAYTDAKVAAEAQARAQADSALNTRLEEVEAFFEGAAKDGEGLNNALDKLIEIQKYLDGDGSAAGGLIDRISQNAQDIKAITKTAVSVSYDGEEETLTLITLSSTQ